MLSIGIGEIQKNTSILSKLTEAVAIIDKRKKMIVATVYPVKQTNIVSKLAGKYKNRVTSIKDLEEVKQKAMMMAMEEKYGKFN